ncbi:MAG: protein disulfide isomerase family protein [Thermoplasmata archaeon]
MKIEIKDYADQISKLKEVFVEKWKSGERNLEDLIYEMRKIHGKALIEMYIEINNVYKKGIEQTTPDDCTKISTMESFLFVIHSTIRNCEKLIYGTKSKKISLSSSTSELDVNVGSPTTKKSPVEKSKTPTKEPSHAMRGNIYKTVIREGSEKQDELSVKRIKSESPTSSAKHDIIPSSRKFDTSEFVSQLTTTEAEKLFSAFKQEQAKKASEKDVSHSWMEKPTLVNFWADWCPFSIKFKPEWDAFVKMAKEMYKDINLEDVNVKKDMYLAKMAQDCGVDGYPSLVFFYKGKKYITLAGNLEKDDIRKFVEKIISEYGNL